MPPSKPLLAVLCVRRARCRDRPTGLTELGVLDVVPLSVATGTWRRQDQLAERVPGPCSLISLCTTPSKLLLCTRWPASTSRTSSSPDRPTDLCGHTK
jgi:hypothetical protein